jgi:RNA polymerase-binding protein DksA
VTVDTERFRARLQDERQRVAHAIEYIHKEHPGSLVDETGDVVTSSSIDQHMGDTATDTFDRELDYTLEGNAEEVLRAIDTALGRIDDGSYGTCEVCGKEIPEERLEARPWATLCIDDQRKAEAG